MWAIDYKINKHINFGLQNQIEHCGQILQTFLRCLYLEIVIVDLRTSCTDTPYSDRS